MDQNIIHQAMNEQELIQACKNEKDVKTKERSFLVKQVFFDNQIASHVAKNLGHVRSWPYKWPGRFEEHGMDGLHDRQRTGRPPKMPKDRLVAIERQIAGNPAGWSAKQVMSLIYEKSGVRYHEVHVYRLLHSWGYASKVAQKGFVNSATAREKLWFKKNLRKE